MDLNVQCKATWLHETPPSLGLLLYAAMVGAMLPPEGSAELEWLLLVCILACPFEGSALHKMVAQCWTIRSTLHRRRGQGKKGQEEDLSVG